jgi:hypothetical protein
LTPEECTRHVGDAVIYKPRTDAVGRPGKIRSVSQMLASVEFTDFDGGVLQCNPYCLELADEPTLFGNAHTYPPGYPELGG